VVHRAPDEAIEDERALGSGHREQLTKAVGKPADDHEAFAVRRLSECTGKRIVVGTLR